MNIQPQKLVRINEYNLLTGSVFCVYSYHFHIGLPLRHCLWTDFEKIRNRDSFVSFVEQLQQVYAAWDTWFGMLRAGRLWYRALIPGANKGLSPPRVQTGFSSHPAALWNWPQSTEVKNLWCYAFTVFMAWYLTAHKDDVYRLIWPHFRGLHDLSTAYLRLYFERIRDRLASYHHSWTWSHHIGATCTVGRTLFCNEVHDVEFKSESAHRMCKYDHVVHINNLYYTGLFYRGTACLRAHGIIA